MSAKVILKSTFSLLLRADIIAFECQRLTVVFRRVSDRVGTEQVPARSTARRDERLSLAGER